jgi:hypothetical protein
VAKVTAFFVAKYTSKRSTMTGVSGLIAAPLEIAIFAIFNNLEMHSNYSV